MPRKTRQKSSLSIYHVILRGINQQIIFEDKYDYSQFISIMKYYKEECGFELFAYCLMNNHIHLLIKHSEVELDVIMKKIEVKFVRWYNRKYQRVGYLFQDRFKSEPIEDLSYFITAFRYIHQNPMHAGIEAMPGTYPWSSYQAYAHSDDSFVDINGILKFFPNHEECINFLHTSSNTKCLEHFSSKRLPDTVALEIIKQITPCNSPSDFQHLDISVRNEYLKNLMQYGFSMRQLSRLTGISRTTISCAIKKSQKGQ